MDWSKIVNEILIHHKVRQRELAKMSGVGAVYINQLKTGKRKSPNFINGLRLIVLHPNRGEILHEALQGK